MTRARRSGPGDVYEKDQDALDSGLGIIKAECATAFREPAGVIPFKRWHGL